MKHSAHNGVHALKNIWHIGRQMNQLSVEIKLGSFLKPTLLRSKTSTASESSVDERMYSLL
jgi:hypothetical protein